MFIVRWFFTLLVPAALAFGVAYYMAGNADGPAITINQPSIIGQGGTLANLRGFVESRGAKVIGATALTGKGYSAKLSLSEETLRGLKGKHGTELEQWWVAAFGYGFERLTESEARYLTRADDAHSISARIVAATRK